MRIPEAIIEEIKFRVNLEDIISTYVTLKRSGSNLSGLCPFHSEKTPSFTLFLSGDPHFYCFGCGAGGDAITFIMRIENLDYISAVEFLAKRAGITIPRTGEEEGRQIKRSRVISMNCDAAKFYHSELSKSPIALNYLSERGISTPLIRRFGLGFAPDDFGALTTHMTSIGYNAEELSAGFLCGISKKTGRPYDYFRGRIIFPIIEPGGDVIAFGGRVIDESMPKYLNSSDTPAFRKSKTLFALNFAKDNCSEYVILCEGYMDVIALHGSGFKAAVATLGTAITPEHARMLKRYTKKVIISYDSDSAGQRAADKAFKLLGETGLETKILRIDGAKDPDEYIKKYGRIKFKLLLEDSKSEFEFKLETILNKYDIGEHDGKIKAANELISVISSFNSAVEREIYINYSAIKLGVSPEMLKSDVGKSFKKRTKEVKREQTRTVMRLAEGYGDRINPDSVKNIRAAKAEEAALGILLLRPEMIRKVKNGEIDLKLDYFTTSFGKRVFDYIISSDRPDTPFEFGLLGSEFNVDEMGRITKMRVARESLTENGLDILIELAEVLKSEIKKQQAGIEDIIRAKRNNSQV